MGILEEVNASYEKLSPVQKRIADFIFKYPDQVCFYSLKELSETLGVTEVTILRFTKKIGAQSFVEMKNRLRKKLLETLLQIRRLQMKILRPQPLILCGFHPSIC